MELFVVLPLMLSVMGAVFALIIAFVVIRATKTPAHKIQQPGWQPTPPGQPSFDSSVASWNAQILGDGIIGALGGTLNSGFGRFDLRGGRLSFTADGAQTPAWDVACAELQATHHGMFSVATVTLRGPMGDVRCNVSVEHINRFSRNSVKTMRESGHAKNFVQALHAHGARP